MSSPDYPMNGDRGPDNRFSFALGGLGVLAALIAAASIAGAVVLLRRQGYQFSAGDITLFGVILLLGVCGIGLALAAIGNRRQLRRLGEQLSSLEQRTAIIAEQSVAKGRAEPPAPVPHIDPAELRAILAEIRDILLLPQEHRLRRYQALVEAEYTRRLAAAERFIASRDFHRARAELTALTQRFEMDDRIRDARNRLEQAADEARAQDIAQAATRIQDLMGLGRWAEAEHLARELADKYPAAGDAAALLERVSRERRLFEQRHRQRMLEEIQQLVHQRRWREAAEGTRRFLEMFPNDIEAPPLREQLKTLDANAEIQTRQQLEAQYKELIQQHRYWDAVGLANRIIAQYPMSPQANALRGQIGRLEELARRYEPQR
ncbi:MAG: hypothetical protein GXW89_06950 [Phycisphaerae bacterium]|nr:hypothetical protein [Phycisphaerae bacterium]